MDEAQPSTIPGVLSELAAILPKLTAAVERQSATGSRVLPLSARLTFRIDELAEAMGLSRRAVERGIAAGTIPRADLRVGKVPLWRVQTLTDWLGAAKYGGH